MKKLLYAMIFMLPFWAAGQVRTVVPTGKHYVMTLGNTDYVKRADRPTVVTGPSDILIADSIFQVSSSMPNDSIINPMNRIPLGKKWAILLQRGSNRTTTITIPKDSIVLASYGTGAQPIISGSQAVTGWTQTPSTTDNPSIYQASFSSNATQLFVDGVKMQVARLSGYSDSYFGYTEIDTVISSTKLDLEGIDLQKDSLKNAVAITRTYNWLSEIRYVTGSNGDTITLNSPSQAAYNSNQGVLLMNKLWFLDSPGEWYNDTTANLIYLFAPDGTSPSDNVVLASTVDNGVVINNKDRITIRNITFKHQRLNGVKIEGGANGTTGPDYVTVQNCNFTGQDNFGIFVFPQAGIATNMTFSRNVISDISGAGIYGRNVKTSNINNNLIYDIGLFRTWGIVDNKIAQIEDINGSAIHFSLGSNGTVTPEVPHTGSNIIEYNIIKNTGYNGILYRSGGHIRYNYVYNTGLAKADGGGIYTDAPQASGSQIKFNIVDRSIGRLEGAGNAYDQAYNIYLDEKSLNVTVENNTVVNSTDAGIFLHRPSGHTVRYNKVFDGAVSFMIKGGITPFASNNITNNLFATGNTIIPFSPYRQLLMFVGGGYNNESVYATINNNIYINPYSSLAFARQPAYSGLTYSDYATFNSITSYNATSTLISTALTTNQQQRLVYNPQQYAQTFYFNNAGLVKDSANVTIPGMSFVLQPFTSKYVRGLNVDCIQPYYEVVAPVITAFDIPATVTGLSVPLNNFTVTGETTGYLITEVEGYPGLSHPGWTTTKPTQYWLTSAGNKTLYAWARDAVGNVSESASDVVVSSYNDDALNRELVVVYDLEETTGLAKDSSLNARHSTTAISEFITINQPGNPGKAYSFAGTTFSNNRVLISDHPVFTMTDSMTIVTWVNLATIDKEHALVFKGATNQYEYLVSVQSDNRVQFDIFQAGTETRMTVKGLTQLVAGTDYMIEVSAFMDATPTPDIWRRSDMKIRINGVEQTLIASNNTSISGIINGTGSFMMGAQSYVDRFLTGKLSQVALWTRILTDDQRTALYKGGAGLNKSAW